MQRVQIWVNAKMIVDMGANLNMTRTPDAHFFAEARPTEQAIVCAPDFSMVSKFADQWVPLHAGSDGAFWLAITHVLLKEFYVDRRFHTSSTISRNIRYAIPNQDR